MHGHRHSIKGVPKTLDDLIGVLDPTSEAPPSIKKVRDGLLGLRREVESDGSRFWFAMPSFDDLQPRPGEDNDFSVHRIMTSGPLRRYTNDGVFDDTFLTPDPAGG